MNDRPNISRHLDTLRGEDISRLAKAAWWEANTNYPVPRVMSQQACEELLWEVLPERSQPKSFPNRDLPRTQVVAPKTTA